MLITKLSTLATEETASPGVAARLEERLSLLFIEGELLAQPESEPNADVSEWVIRGLPGWSRDLRVACQTSELMSARTRLELVSYDRPLPEAGWLFQTSAEVLLCWFPTNEVAVLPVSGLRELVLKEPARLEATTVLNGPGLSWMCVEDTDYLVWKLTNARVLNLHYELNEPVRARTVFGEHNADKQSELETVLGSLRTVSTTTQKRTVGELTLKDLMSQMSAVNRMRDEPTHKARIKTLPWKL